MTYNESLTKSLISYIKNVVNSQENHSLKLKSYSIGLINHSVESNEYVFTADLSPQGDGNTYYCDGCQSNIIDIEEFDLDNLLCIVGMISHSIND